MAPKQKGSKSPGTSASEDYAKWKEEQETGAASSSAPSAVPRKINVGGYRISAYVDADQASSSAARDEEVWMHYFFCFCL